MGFAERLKQATHRPPLMFEPLPPSKSKSPDEVEAHVRQLIEALDQIPRVDAVNIPQVIGGAFETVSARRYAQRLHASSDHEALVNTIVALHPEAELLDWIRETHAEGVHHLILVGGESSAIRYPGPTVPQANELVANTRAAGTHTIGNICIPFRRSKERDEPDRMVAKTRAGADYFTSQIVLEPITTRRLLRDYGNACQHAGIAPATIFIGLAPVTEPRDLELMGHLGVEIPPHVSRDLLWDKNEIGRRSLELNLGILRNILDTIRREHIPVPIGLNVEQVSMHNWEASIELAQEATFLLEEHQFLLDDSRTPARSGAAAMEHAKTPHVETTATHARVR